MKEVDAVIFFIVSQTFLGKNCAI